MRWTSHRGQAQFQDQRSRRVQCQAYDSGSAPTETRRETPRRAQASSRRRTRARCVEQRHRTQESKSLAALATMRECTWTSESIQENHPELTLAQIDAALAWYYDNQSVMDDEIEQQAQRLAALREQLGPSPLQRRLAMRGRGS